MDDSAETARLRRFMLFVMAVSLVLALSWLSASAEGPLEIPESSYNLLTNPSLEQYDAPYGQWHPWNVCWVDEQVASGWQRFFSLDEPEPAWLDARVFANSCMGSGWVECINGQTCQFIAGLQPYDGGIYQRVTGLTPGVGYGFHAVLMTLWRSAGDPKNDDRMFKQIGLDPSGGTDPQAPTVLWNEPNGLDKEFDFEWAAAVAEGTSMTAFMRINSVDGCNHWQEVNLSILDSAILAKTPTVSAFSPPTSPTPAFWVSWDNWELAPGAVAFQGCDVQWMDEAVGEWTDWFTQTMETEATFTGQMGHTYRFRARAWQSYGNGAWLHGPYAEPYDSRTQVTWATLTGHVWSPEGRPLWGAKVAVAETGQETTTGTDGSYRLYLKPSQGDLTISGGLSGWRAPAPVHVVDVGQGDTVTVDWVLRPPDDAMVNGEFEEGLDGWLVLSDGGVTPHVVSDPVHSGDGALKLGGVAAPSHTVGVSQTVELMNGWEPALSFWYWPTAVDQGDVFSVVLTLVQDMDPSSAVTTTSEVMPSLDVDGWTHFWTYAGPPETTITGTLSLEFLVRDDGAGATVVYIDEVNVGATPGGPYRIYLPLAYKHF